MPRTLFVLFGCYGRGRKHGKNYHTLCPLGGQHSQNSARSKLPTDSSFPASRGWPWKTPMALRSCSHSSIFRMDRMPHRDTKRGSWPNLLIAGRGAFEIMKYTKQKDPAISGLSPELQNLPIYESSDIIRRLAAKIKQDATREQHLCEFEDGRRKWMVTYDKYSRLKQQNLQLKAENENLKAAILKLSTNPPNPFSP